MTVTDRQLLADLKRESARGSGMGFKEWPEPVKFFNRRMGVGLSYLAVVVGGVEKLDLPRKLLQSPKYSATSSNSQHSRKRGR